MSHYKISSMNLTPGFVFQSGELSRGHGAGQGTPECTTCDIRRGLRQSCPGRAVQYDVPLLLCTARVARVLPHPELGL